MSAVRSVRVDTGRLLLVASRSGGAPRSHGEHLGTTVTASHSDPWPPSDSGPWPPSDEYQDYPGAFLSAVMMAG